MIALKLVGGAYIAIGFLNSLFVWATVSLHDCADAIGVLGVYCDTPIGISHFVSILLWPLFWL